MAFSQSAASVLFEDTVGAISILKDDARAACALLIAQRAELDRLAIRLDNEPVGTIIDSLRTKHAERSRFRQQ